MVYDGQLFEITERFITLYVQKPRLFTIDTELDDFLLLHEFLLGPELLTSSGFFFCFCPVSTVRLFTY